MIRTLDRRKIINHTNPVRNLRGEGVITDALLKYGAPILLKGAENFIVEPAKALGEKVASLFRGNSNKKGKGRGRGSGLKIAGDSRPLMRRARYPLGNQQGKASSQLFFLN